MGLVGLVGLVGHCLPVDLTLATAATRSCTTWSFCSSSRRAVALPLPLELSWSARDRAAFAATAAQSLRASFGHGLKKREELERRRPLLGPAPSPSEDLGSARRSSSRCFFHAGA